MKVKICGITHQEDAFICEELGADALGLVYFPGRSRSLDLDTISEVMSTVGPFTRRVLVCNPSSVEEALFMIERTGADLLQVYNLDVDELLELKEYGVDIIRAVPPVREEAVKFAQCTEALIFEGSLPGTGTEYDYETVPVDACRRAIIAGGLKPDNVDRVKKLSPYGVDVSSGVESIPGRKDPLLVEEFIRRCRA